MAANNGKMPEHNFKLIGNAIRLKISVIDGNKNQGRKLLRFLIISIDKKF